MDDDGWQATRQALLGDAGALTYLRLRPDAQVPRSPAATPATDQDAGEVHVALLDGPARRRTLCGCSADPDLIQVVDELGDKPCLRCVARAAELACLTGSSRR